MCITICSTGELSKFLACVYDLAYDEKPKYQVLKKILLDGLESSGTCYDGPLDFSAAACMQNHCTAKASKVSSGIISDSCLIVAFSFEEEEMV